jgi:hypothetical protein
VLIQVSAARRSDGYSCLVEKLLANQSVGVSGCRVGPAMGRPGAPRLADRARSKW